MRTPTILIAGLGSIGRRHLRNLRLLGDYPVIGYRSGQGGLLEHDLRDIVVENDLSKALDHHPDIAIISNPTALHLETAIPCAEAGCNLFIEKPLSHHLAGCDRLEKIVRRNRLVVMIGCQFRFHPLLLSLKSQLDDGRIGKVIGARAEWGEYLPDWHPWENYRCSYSARKELGGGVTLTLIHPVDYLYWLFGSVVRVKAMASKILSLETDVEDDYLEMTIRHLSGVISQVHLDYLQRPPIHTLTVRGEAGRVEWNDHAGLLVWKDPAGRESHEGVSPGFDRNELFLQEMRHFLQCVDHSQKTRVPLEDGIEVMKIVSRALGKNAR